MVRPCVARGFVDPVATVLHQCIRTLLGAHCAPGHHGYQRACDLISGQASTGPLGPPVFASAGKTDFSIIISSSRRPRRVVDYDDPASYDLVQVLQQVKDGSSSKPLT